MTLQMFGASMRQWFVTTLSRGKRDFIVPWPEKAEKPKEIGKHEDAQWACNKVSLLDFLRKTNKDGKICHWLGKRKEELGKWHLTLEDIRKFYIDCAEELKVVPDEHRNFAMPLLCKHKVAQDMWHNDVAIEAELKQEAYTKKMVRTLMGSIKSTRALLLKYLSGELDYKREKAKREEQQKHVAEAMAIAPDGAHLAFNDQHIAEQTSAHGAQQKKMQMTSWRMPSRMAKCLLAMEVQELGRPQLPSSVWPQPLLTEVVFSLPTPRTGKPAGCAQSSRKKCLWTRSMQLLAWMKNQALASLPWPNTI